MIDIYLFFHHRQRLVRFLCECYEKWRSLTVFFVVVICLDHVKT